RDYVDFAGLSSPIGIAIVPKVDDVELKPAGNGVSVMRPGGLAISRTRDLTQKSIEQNVSSTAIESDSRMKRISDFDRWMVGGPTALRDNQHILLGGMAEKDQTGRVQDLLTLAKMNLANERGQE